MQEKSYVLVDTFDKLKDMVNHVKDKEIINYGDRRKHDNSLIYKSKQRYI